MRKQILLLDKSSLQRLKQEEISYLNSIYDIRYSPILSYELLIGSIKYGREKIDEFIQSKMKSEYHVCYDTTAEIIKKEIIENIPITKMDYAKIGETEDLKREIKNLNQYAKQQFEEEQKIFEILKKHLENNQDSNYIIEFAEIINQLGNPRTNQRRLIEDLQKYLSKCGNENVNNDMEKFIKNNIKNNSKKFKKETMQKMFLTDALIADIENLFNENTINSINTIASIAKLTEKETQEIKEIINNSNIKISQRYPYTFFCYYIYLLYFNIEKCKFIIQTRGTNFTRDIRYILYLPFCDIFASDDKDLIEICKNINYEYINELKLTPLGFKKFNPQLMAIEELLAQIH